MRFVIFVASVALLLKPASASASACATASQLSADLLSRYKWLAATTDPSNVADRQYRNLPAVSPTQVTLLADTAICRSALNAYNSALLPDTAVSSDVHVIKYGTNRYIVVDPLRTAGEWVYSVVFDLAFSVLRIGRE